MYSVVDDNYYIIKRRLLGHFEYSQQPQGSQYGQTEGTAFEEWPYDFKYGTHDDHAVETVKCGIEIYPNTERVHLDEHFGHEEHQENVFRINCRSLGGGGRGLKKT